MMHPTKMKGSSIAIAFCCEKLLACFAAGETSGSGLSLDSKGIVSGPGEWLRIQPRGESYKQGRAEGDTMRVGHRRRGGMGGFFEPIEAGEEVLRVQST